MKDCNDKTACMGRREFLVKAGLVAGGVVLTVSSLGNSALGAAFEDVTVDVGADSPLAKVGGSQIVDSTAGKIIVIHEPGDKYAAFSANCTHKGAMLEYDAAANKLNCPKHGSAFDGVDGKVLHGPADEPLKAYPSKEADKKVTVTVT
jgi:nitrite reductase/ring-hydroxylating ferredoxin subunit